MNAFFFKNNKLLWQEADFYGAANLIFNKKNKPIIYKASWMHGMGYSFSGIWHKDNFIHSDEIELPIHMVNNEDSVNFLDSIGIQSTPVGMPYIYALETKYPMTKKTSDFIFIPEHNISKTNEQNFDEYVYLCKKYNCNKILLMSNDYLQAKKINFNFQDIVPVRGANVSDPFCLSKLAKIFCNTNTIFTNAFGSHLFYSSISGCDVILVDEILDNYSNQKLLQKKKDLKGKVSEEMYIKYLQKPFPIDNLMNGVWKMGNQKEIREYSEYMLGLGHKKSKSYINKLLTPISTMQIFDLSIKVFKKKLSRKLNGR